MNFQKDIAKEAEVILEFLKQALEQGDDAPMAVIELVDRNVEAKKIDKPKKIEKKENKDLAPAQAASK